MHLEELFLCSINLSGHGVFVEDILGDPIDLAMVKSIHEIGRVTGKKTNAEFVESMEIRDKLKEIGVDYAQGFALGRPRALVEMERPQARRMASG